MPSLTRPEAEAIVREACVAANPSMAMHSSEVLPDGGISLTIDWREPGLADILLALGEMCSVSGGGYVYRYDKEDGEVYICRLDLRAPLSGQSDEAVIALAKLLGK